MQSGFINFLNKISGGKLYHCWFCRLQFYDLRPVYKCPRPIREDFNPPSEGKEKVTS